MADINIVYVNVAELNPAPYNPRKAGDKEVADLRASITSFGLVDPLIVNAADGRRNIVIGGHFRLQVAKAMGYDKVPVVYVNLPDILKEQELNLRLNKNSGSWDYDLLANFNEDMLKGVGFDSVELDKIFQLDDPKADDVPDIRETVDIVPGDMFTLGDHRLLCGDATVWDHVARLMGEEKAQMVFTDPPYNVGYTGGMGGDGNKHRRSGILNDKMSSEKFYKFLYDVFVNLMLVTRGAFYVCMSSSELHNLYRAFTDAGGHWQTYIIWATDSFTLSRSDYQHQFEPIMHGLSEEIAQIAEKEAEPIMYGWSKHEWYGGRKQGDVWLIDRPKRSPEHPTMKPVALCGKAIVNSSSRGGLVCDLFGGSGSTLIASEALSRRCFTMELDPKYCQVIIDRWETFSGQKAVKVNNLEMINA